MSMGRLLTWAFATLLICVPLNWIRLWANGALPATASTSQLIIGTIVCWGVGGGLAWYLATTSRPMKIPLHNDGRDDREQ